MAEKSFGEGLFDSIAQKTGLGKLTAGLDRLRFYKKDNQEAVKPYTGAKFEGEQDFRAYIQLPTLLWQKTLAGGLYLPISGRLIFPNTPTITQDYTASFQALNPVHSNYALYFYKNSQAGPISLSCKFTVQSQQDAETWLATCHVLRFLTKMRFGDDSKSAGTPPPICRFNAYGELQYKNVPVVVSSFKVELPDSVDYYVTALDNSENKSAFPNAPKGSAVPVESTINVTLLPMYSRAELTGLKPDDYLSSGNNLKNKGFL